MLIVVFLLPTLASRAYGELRQPQKIKTFLWKSCKAALPTKASLVRRKLGTDSLCPICGREDESMEHLFLLCHGPKLVWSGSKFQWNKGEASGNLKSLKRCIYLKLDQVPRSEIIVEQRQFWQNCLVAVLIDDGHVKEEQLAGSINKYWLMQDQVRVVGRKKNTFVLEFNNPFDMNFMVEEGPWEVQNKLLVLDHWQPNVILDEYKVVSFPLWVEFWGFPLEYYSSYVAEHVGELVGEVVQVDFSDQGFRNLRYLKVRVNIDPSKPLLMGFYVLLDNGRAIWI
ncbi:Pyruvate carboxyltransferase [Senna tora]|uniref:Pyruvate carboxyltransferase n=1 Tax=Senna tora TaxID=362788 RepID=A0A835CFK3_9FABA|nr:Pyruvate carboxyltransferase [Senna tora]